MNGGDARSSAADDSAGRPDAGRDGWLERLIGRFGGRPKDTVREDLGDMLDEASDDADLSAHERAMMRNVLSLRSVRVSDVMIPRADIVGVAAAVSLGELIAVFRTAGHSRLPVYAETLDEPLGMVHIRDLLEIIAAEGESGSVGAGVPASLAGVDLARTLEEARIMRDVLFVPGAMPVMDLLARMQSSRTHMALVIDEYGGTDGIVSIEDLVETVVGDIEDEHDEATDLIVAEDGGTFLVDARAPLGDAADAFGTDLSAGEEADGVGTIGGLLVARAGRVPRRGETVDGPGGLRFEVLDADVRRLKRLRASRGEPGAGNGSATTDERTGPGAGPAA